MLFFCLASYSSLACGTTRSSWGLSDQSFLQRSRDKIRAVLVWLRLLFSSFIHPRGRLCCVSRFTPSWDIRTHLIHRPDVHSSILYQTYIIFSQQHQQARVCSSHIFRNTPSPSMPPVALRYRWRRWRSCCDFFQHDISGKFLQRTGVTESSDCSRLRISEYNCHKTH
jgi:hypothetical protein